MSDLLQRLFSERIAAGLRAPFVLGDMAELRSLSAAAGLPEVQIATEEGTAHFLSLESWVHTEVKGWTLADLSDDDQRQLLRMAQTELKRFTGPGGRVTFSAPAHIARLTKA